MNNLTLVGVDAGNKNLKVLLNDSKEPIVIPNIIGETDYRAVSERLGSKNKKPINCLDVSIKSNGKDLGRKYVGNLAVQRNNVERPLSKEKYNDDDILFVSLTGIAYALYEPINPVKTVNIALGTCLPTREVLFDDKVAKHEERFIGTHEVTFHDKVFNGAKIVIKIHDGYITTVPEGSIALFNIMTNKDGLLLPEYEAGENDLYIIVDIGGGTTDISAVMDLEQIPNFIDSINQGIIHAEQRVLDRVRVEGDNRGKSASFNMGVPGLDYNIRKGRYNLKFGDDTFNVKEFVDAEFRGLWLELSRDVNDRIQRGLYRLQRNIRGIIITGGSSILLDPYMDERIGEYKVILSKTPLKDNVEGCLKAARVVVRAIEDSSGEDEIYEQA